MASPLDMPPQRARVEIHVTVRKGRKDSYNHFCPGPACRTVVPDHLFCCRRDEAALPPAVRVLLALPYGSPGRVTGERKAHAFWRSLAPNPTTRGNPR
jgi:hypothetical protein